MLSATAKVHAVIAKFTFYGCVYLRVTHFADFLLSLLVHLSLASSTVILVVLGIHNLASFTFSLPIVYHAVYTNILLLELRILEAKFAYISYSPTRLFLLLLTTCLALILSFCFHSITFRTLILPFVFICALSTHASCLFF